MPLLVLLIALGMLLPYQTSRGSAQEGVSGEQASAPPPTWTPGLTSSPAWYCAAGTLGGVADQAITIRNVGDVEATGHITVFISREDTAGDAQVPFTVAAGEQTTVDVARAVGERGEGMEKQAAALVESSSGRVVAEHAVGGDEVSARGPCAPSGQSQWHFAWGDTSRHVQDVLVLFNPFPSDVVVDGRFATSGGEREPVRWRALVVPARRVIAIDVADDVSRRDHVAASIRARNGSLVVERLQIFRAEGSGEREPEVRRMRLALGQQPAANPRLDTVTPLAAWSRSAVAVYNPSDATAEVQIGRAGADGYGGDASQVSLGPGEVRLLDRPTGPISTRLGWDAAVVSSRNGVPIVAEWAPGQ